MAVFAVQNLYGETVVGGGDRWGHFEAKVGEDHHADAVLRQEEHIRSKASRIAPMANLHQALSVLEEQSHSLAVLPVDFDARTTARQQILS